jgi:uncharacterized membrane protein YkvA (DUF1232 family)
MDLRWFRLRDPKPRAKGAGGSPDPEPPAGPIDPTEYVGTDAAANERAVREGFASKAKRHLRRIPMADEVVALYFCLLDGRTPAWVKAVSAAALAYFILPLDALPDLLPALGFSDDIAVLSGTLAAVSGYITEEHRAKARAWLADERILDVTPNGA